MSWGEAHRLTVALASDMSSRLCAALNDWPHPWSRELEIQASTWDLLARVNGGKGKAPTYPRPWDAPARTDRPTLPQSEVRALLARMRHGLVEQAAVEDGGYLPST